MVIVYKFGDKEYNSNTISFENISKYGKLTAFGLNRFLINLPEKAIPFLYDEHMPLPDEECSFVEMIVFGYELDGKLYTFYFVKSTEQILFYMI